MDVVSIAPINQSNYNVSENLIRAAVKYVEDNSSYNIDEAISSVIFNVFMFIALVSVAADILIAFVTIRYKKLRDENLNRLVLNLAILDALFIPILLVLFANWRSLEENTLGAIMVGIEFILYIAILGTVVFLTLDWYDKLYNSDRTVLKKLTLSKIIMYITLGCVAALLVFLFVCGWPYSLVILSFGSLSFLWIYIVYMVAINVVHSIKKIRLVQYKTAKDTHFLLFNAFFLSKVPIALVILSQFGRYGYSSSITITVVLIIALNDGIYFFMILYTYDENYYTCFRHTLSCRRTETEDQVEQPANYTECPYLEEDRNLSP